MASQVFMDIEEVEDRWYDPGAEYFKVRTQRANSLFQPEFDHERSDRLSAVNTIFVPFSKTTR